MPMQPTATIHPVADLKRNARSILRHMHATGRPVVLTTKGKAEAVLLDARVYERHLQASNLAPLLAAAEDDVSHKRTRPIRAFLREFKNARAIRG